MGSCFCTSAHLTPHINMKFLVLSVVLSAATAAPSFLGLVGHPNGAVVPVDEPAVAAARADHLGALAVTNGAAIGHAVAAVPAVAAAPVAYAAAPAIAAAPVVAHGYAGPLNLNTHLVGHPNGAVVPADEPAVAAARADHFAAGGGQAAPVVAAPVVAAAAPLVAAAAPVVAHGYAGPLNLNTHLVGHPNGAVVPADEPAVAAARADHFAAGGGQVHAAPVVAAPVAAAPIVAAAVPAVAAAPVVAAAGYAGPLNLNVAPLVAHPNGAVVPADEPAVVAARADHLATKGHY